MNFNMPSSDSWNFIIGRRVAFRGEEEEDEKLFFRVAAIDEAVRREERFMITESEASPGCNLITIFYTFDRLLIAL